MIERQCDGQIDRQTAESRRGCLRFWAEKVFNKLWEISRCDKVLLSAYLKVGELLRYCLSVFGC